MESILGQKLTDWELIVCDSYSDDGSWEYFQRFKDEPRIRLYEVPREGIYAGWNECLRRAKGEYIYIATSDDTCRPELLEKLVGMLEREKTTASSQYSAGDEQNKTPDHNTSTFIPHPSSPSPHNSPSLQHSNTPSRQPFLPADIAACAFDFIDENGRIINPAPMGRTGEFYGKWLNKQHRRSGLLEFLVHLWLGISWTTMTAVVFRRSLLGKTGLFRTDVGVGADMYWAAKSALHSDTLWIPDRLATWRWHAGQRSVGGGSHYRVAEGVRVNRRRVKLMAETIDACIDLIPSCWKKDAAWRDKLLWGANQYYRSSFCLDRNSVRSHPAAFMTGLGLALIYEPRFLIQRFASRLSWQSAECTDWSRRLHVLIKEWEVPCQLT